MAWNNNTTEQIISYQSQTVEKTRAVCYYAAFSIILKSEADPLLPQLHFSLRPRPPLPPFSYLRYLPPVDSQYQGRSGSNIAMVGRRHARQNDFEIFTVLR